MDRSIYLLPLGFALILCPHVGPRVGLSAAELRENAADRSARQEVSIGPALEAPNPIREEPSASLADRRSMDATGASPVGTAPPRALPQSSGSLLLPPPRRSGRSEQLERMAQQADVQIRRGFELAGRNAHFAARLQFVRALRLISQALDAEHGTTMHSRSLAAGLTAVKEVKDFIPNGVRLEADLDIADIIGNHRTPVLKDIDPNSLTPMLGVKRYLTFAQEQLGAAAGREVAGSMALHALGKLHGRMAADQGVRIKAAEAKAVTFYQAALLAFPKNHMAANDLGVLLARCGNYPQAERMLRHSISVRAQAVAWNNLAHVLQLQGKAAMAEQARHLSSAARRRERGVHHVAARTGPPLRWVDPGTLSQSHTGTPQRPTPAQQRSPLRSQQASVEPSKPAADQPPPRKATGFGWLPNIFKAK